MLEDLHGCLRNRPNHRVEIGQKESRHVVGLQILLGEVHRSSYDVPNHGADLHGEDLRDDDVVVDPMDGEILPVVVGLTGDEALAVEEALLSGVVLVEKMARRDEFHVPHRLLDCTH